MSISTTFRLFHVLTSAPPFSVRQISIKLFYLYQRHEYRDNYVFKIKFVFFLYLLLSVLWNEHDLSLYISDIKDRTLKLHISIEVFVVYIDIGSSMPISPSKSRDLADENNKFWRNGNDSKQPYCPIYQTYTGVPNISIYSAVSLVSPYYNYL
jgi:hypothetical protein